MTESDMGDIEFERNPSKFEPSLEPKTPPRRSEPEAQKAPADRQTDDAGFDREQQPVVTHQDRRRK
jgi:hypothetical protein